MNYIKSIYTPSGLDLFELDYISSLDPIDSNVIVVVPEQFAFDAEKYLLENLGKKGLFNVRIYGLKKLVYELAYLVRVSSSDIISDFSKNLIMTRILKKLDNKLSFYKGSYKSKSRVEMIYYQLDEFRLEEVSETDLFDSSEDYKETNHILSRKLFELSIILKEYKDYFSPEKIDEINLISMLTEFFLSDDFEKNSFMIDDYNLIVEGFSGMSELEINLLAAISSRAENSYIRILLAKNGVASRYSNKFKYQLEKAFKNIREPYLVEEYFDKKSQSESNAFAFADLFEYGDRIFSEKVNFEIVSAKDKNEEITYIAEDILSKMRNENAIWSDFAIVSTSEDAYNYNIDKIFQNYKIPYFMDEKIPITSFNFVLFIIFSLRAVKNNYLNKNLIEVFKLSTYFNFDEESFKRDYNLATEIERYVLKMNINYDSWFNPNSWAYLDHKDKDEIIEYKDIILDKIAKLKESLENNSDLKSKSRALKNYLDTYNFDETIDAKIQYYSEKDDEEQAKLYSTIKTSLETIFSEIDVFAGDIEADTGYFIDLFLSALSNYKAGQTPPNKLKVVFGSIGRSRFIGVKYLYVIAANEGSLPSVAASNSIFTSNELALLDKTTDFDLITASKFMDKEVFDLYEKIISASVSTTFTYSRTNEKSDELLPSNWIKGLKKAYNIEEKEVELSLQTVLKTGIKSAFYKEFLLNYRPYEFRNKTYEDFESYFNAEELLKTYLLDKKDEYKEKLASKVSVSRLEQQALCPYGFFVKYVLKPKKNSFEKIDYALFGTVYHRALEYFVNEYLASNDKEEFSENSEKILKEKFNQSIEKEDILKVNLELKSRLIFYEPAMKYVSKSILKQLETDGGCKMKSITEKEFEHIFKNGDREFKIRGKIDRLDIVEYNGKKYLRIVDYKTGKKEFNKSDVEEGLDLQLLTYLKSIIDGEYSEQNPEVLGAFYHSIKEKFSNVSLEKAGESSLENYKLSGIYLENEDLVKAVDKDLLERGRSSTTNISLKKGGGISNRSKVLQSKEDFEALFEITMENIWRLFSEIENADISVKDHDSKDMPCEYCGYNGILKLDKMKYRDLF